MTSGVGVHRTRLVRTRRQVGSSGCGRKHEDSFGGDEYQCLDLLGVARPSIMKHYLSTLHPCLSTSNFSSTAPAWMKTCVMLTLS